MMLELTPAEKAMLRGDYGAGVRRAMEIVCALADVAAAQRLVEVESVQVAGVSYTNLGDAGLEFLESWASEGAVARVPAWMNPCGADLENWEALGFPAEFVRKQRRVVEALSAMGVEPTLSCAPYHVHTPPGRGAHLAWSESSAVSVANSVFGARTNREGGPSALAAALCGRTPLSGLHLDEARRATVRVEVGFELTRPSDFGALGALVGRDIGGATPWFEGVTFPSDVGAMPCLKQLAAAMAASGAVALFHVPGVTPEACDASLAPPQRACVRYDDRSCLDAALLQRPGGSIDLVALGCPHVSIEEIERIAALLRGRRTRTRLWVCASRAVAEEAARLGFTETIESSGGRLVCDTCVVVAPLEDLGIAGVATNSAKAAIYAGMHGQAVRFGSLEQCVDAAVLGQWPEDVEPIRLRGRAIVSGEAEAELLVTRDPISFYGGVDPRTGEVRDRGHGLFGQSIAGKALAFPSGKGSTVGSYVIYALKRNGVAPAAILVEKADPIVAAGAVIAGLPAICGIEISRLATGRRARIRGGEVEVE